MLTDELLREDVRPLPGRCVVELDEPVTIGSIIIPEAARGARLGEGDKLRQTDTVYSGKMLKFQSRLDKEGVAWEEDLTGKRVFVALRSMDLGKKVIVTHNTRVRAVIE